MVILVTAGGTGGHIFPGIALFNKLTLRGHEVLFIGAQRDHLRFECLEKLGNRFVGFDVQQVYRRKIWKNFSSLRKFLKSLKSAFALIRSFNPAVCVGMGGFASVPLLLACRLKKIPYCIAEQNAIPGRANRFLAKRASAIFLNFDQALSHFSGRLKERCHLVGNPVRPGFGGLTRAEARKRLGLELGNKFVLGVTGGSQGAMSLNQAIIDYVKTRSGFALIWSTGQLGFEDVKLALAGRRDVYLYSFVEDMAAFLAASDLVVSRSGATSLAELAATGSASILVPYPWAADDHQRKNARAIEDEGAAVVVSEGEDFSERLGRVIEKLREEPQTLKAMQKAALRLHNPATLKTIADLVIEQADPGREVR